MSHVMSQLNHYKSELPHYFKSNGTIHGSSNDASSTHNYIIMCELMARSCCSITSCYQMPTQMRKTSCHQLS